MARWTVGPDDNLVITASPDDPVTLHIPSGKPLTVDADTARDIRLKLGAAIAVAQGESTS